VACSGRQLNAQRQKVQMWLLQCIKTQGINDTPVTWTQKREFKAGVVS
jgi:hypothetical protein